MPQHGRYRWVEPHGEEAAVRAIQKKLGVSEVLARVLVNRGHTPKTAAAFLSSTILRPPEEVPGLMRMVSHLRRVIREHRQMLVYGDPSLDGICAVAIMTSAIRRADGSVRFAFPRLPEDGYGLSDACVKRAVQNGMNHLVILDTSRISTLALECVHRSGGKILVLDHHPVRLSHPAVIAVNTADPEAAYPFRDLPASVLAYKAAQLLLGPELAEEYSELAALAILDDQVPLLDENRAALRRGLNHLSRTRNLGLGLLKNQAGLSPGEPVNLADARLLAEQIAALALTAGAGQAAQLLLTSSRSTAETLAVKAAKAQQALVQGVENLVPILQEHLSLLPYTVARDAVVMACSPDVLANREWNDGMLLPLARRLAERLEKPVVLLSGQGDVRLGVAVRTPERDLFAVLEEESGRFASLARHGDVLLFTLPASACVNLSAVIQERMRQRFPSGFGHPTPTLPELRPDAWLKPHEISVDLVRELRLLEPYGPGNPPPLFGLRRVQAKRRYFAPPPTPLMRTYLYDHLTGLRLAAHWPRQMDQEDAPEHDTYLDVIGTPFLYEKPSIDVLRFEVVDWRPVSGVEMVQTSLPFVEPGRPQQKQKKAAG